MESTFKASIGDRAVLFTSDSIGFATVENERKGLVLSSFGYCEKAIGDIRFENFSIPMQDIASQKKELDIALIAFSELFIPYNFGFSLYDPFEAISTFIDKSIINEDNSNSLLSLIWASLERDLFRFTIDEALKQSLETHHGSEEWWRFAKLNDSYRFVIQAICPTGIVPRNWKNLESEQNYKTRQNNLIESIFIRDLSSVTKKIEQKARITDFFTCY